MPLVLSRKIDETITIGSDIRVTVVEISGNKVRLMVDAPREVPVFREEIATRMPSNESGDSK